MRLLLAEDDRALADGLQSVLEAAGYAVDRAGDGEDALYLGQTEDYDLVILDLGLPRLGGIQVLEDWRRGGRAMPVIILTARDTWREKVLGLKAGADDYLTKPFHPEELLARLAALLRRAYGRAVPEIASKAFTLDEDHQRVLRADGTLVELTGTEFRLLRYFMLNPGRLLSKTRLTEHVYDQDFDLDSNVIEVYVRRLREKLGKDAIETKRGQGYVFRG
ncbi:MAG: response regulator transcription factor [Chromatiaceae bacterium]|jgi:two-component system, OmpR family, response regulator|nr:response regulator transcription factor [Chromatiaceae bacterium]